MADMKIKELEQMIGYTFRDPQMLLDCDVPQLLCQ